MTHTSTEQPEARDLAYWIAHTTDNPTAALIQSLHARVQELEFRRDIASACFRNISTASQAQRVPLSEPITHAAYRPTWDGETWAMTQIIPMNSIKVDQLKTHWVTHRDFSDDPFTAGLRYAERAHGITQEKQG